MERFKENETIRQIPTETLEKIELEAEDTGNWEASQLVGEELYRRALAWLLEGYDQLAAYMAESNYPMILNQTEVSVTDQEAYDRSVRATIGDIGDYVPDDWVD